MEALYKIDMITIIFAFKIVVLGILLTMSGVSFFHLRETGRMEKRLGILLPQPVRIFTNFHLIITFIAVFIVSILLFF